MAILPLLFAALLSANAFAQTTVQLDVWTPRGPEGGSVGRPVIDPRNPGTLYLGAGGTLFQTTDAANHWTNVGAYPGTVLAVDPRNSNTLYGTGPSKSTDGGQTWNAPAAGFPGPCADLAVVIDPGNTSTVYDGCRPWGIFKSTDGGATWSAASSGLPAENGYVPITALLIDPRNPSTLYAAAGWNLALFKSTDGAASWSPVWSSADSGLPANRPLASVAIDPRNPNTLYVDALRTIARSTDGAKSWTVVSTLSGELEPRDLVVDPQDSSIYAVSAGGIEKSSDGGASWTLLLSSERDDEWTWVTLAPAAGGTSTVYAGDDWRGVLKTTDGGVTWTRANSGLIATSIDSLAIDPHNPGMLYAIVNGAGLRKTTNNGETWSTSLLPVAYAVAVDPRNAGTVYAWDGNGVWKSVDGGSSWAQLPLPADDAGNLAMDPQSPDTVYYYYASGYGFKSIDGGASWSKLSGFSGFITALAADPQNAGVIYAGSTTPSSSGVLKSVDGGQSWSGVNTLWQRVAVSKIAVDPADSSNVYAEIGYGDCSEYSCDAYDRRDPEVLKLLGIYKSSDGGATWAKLDVPGDPSYASILAIDRQGTLYSRAQSGLLRSQDGGATWNPLPTTGLKSDAWISGLVIDSQDPNHLFAGAYGGGLFEIILSPR